MGKKKEKAKNTVPQRGVRKQKQKLDPDELTLVQGLDTLSTGALIALHQRAAALIKERKQQSIKQAIEESKHLLMVGDIVDFTSAGKTIRGKINRINTVSITIWEDLPEGGIRRWGIENPDFSRLERGGVVYKIDENGNIVRQSNNNTNNSDEESESDSSVAKTPPPPPKLKTPKKEPTIIYSDDD